MNKNLILKSGTLICNAEIFAKPLLELDNNQKFTHLNASALVDLGATKLEGINEKLRDIENLEYRESLKNLLVQYPDVLSGKNEPLGYTTAIKHKIRLSDNTPIYVPAYRIPHKYSNLA